MTVIDLLIVIAAALAVIVVAGVIVLRTNTPYRSVTFDTVTRH
jgi:hypothetical protein